LPSTTPETNRHANSPHRSTRLSADLAGEEAACEASEQCPMVAIEFLEQPSDLDHTTGPT
jgi:hypothetical protein